MDKKFLRLIELGAGDFEQADADLIAHLEGTCCLLKEWHASQVLQQAGLYHVAYGSSVSADGLFEAAKRQEVIAVIGEKPEELVYHYFACDKELFFAQFGKIKHPIFYDRLTNRQLKVSHELLSNLCELFVAKEIDLAVYNPVYAAEHGKRLLALFTPMKEYLSSSAMRKMDYVFAAKE